MRLLLVCGSLQSSSSNLALLRRVAELAEEDQHEVTHFDGIRDLPHFDLDLNEAAPAPVRAWREAITSADAVFIASPEYGHSLPGALKNAIDWVFGSGELNGKPVVLTAAVREPNRGRRGLRALRQTLLSLGARVMSWEPIRVDGEFDDALRDRLGALVAPAVDTGGPLPEALSALLEETSVEGAIELPEPLRLDPTSHLGDVAHTMGAQLGLELPSLPVGELALLMRRIEAALASRDARSREAVRTRLLPALLAAVDGTAALAPTLEALGPLSLAALDDED